MLFFSPISASTRPSRTRRSAMPRYSSRAFSSVVPSSAKRAVLRLQVGHHRAPDVLELLLDQRRRRGELVQLVELVEQPALELLAAHGGVLAREAVLERGPELVERIHAERFRERVVDRHAARGLDRFRRHLEHGRLAGQFRREIILRERDVDGAGLARRHADQLVLEPGMKVPEPTLTPTSSPVPPSNGVPSILPVKSIVTRSPFSTLAPSPFGTERPVRARRSCRAPRSTSSSATSAVSRSSEICLKSASVIFGSTSSASV